MQSFFINCPDLILSGPVGEERNLLSGSFFPLDIPQDMPFPFSNKILIISSIIFFHLLPFLINKKLYAQPWLW